ncbi:prephenate dehydratase [Verrucomicrobiota bacterium]
MSETEVAYLGPQGTYSHLVAEKVFGRQCTMMPFSTITDVCAHVARNRDRRGIVPIENSSGGAIYETVDILLGNKPRVCIGEEVTLKVNLALLGRKGEKIGILYSHFAPLEHCTTWLKRRLPHVEKQVVSSTAVAARRAFVDSNAAALGHRKLAKLCNLDVLEYPVEADVPNITMFLSIGGGNRILPEGTKTTLAVNLPNKPGALCTFLEAFRSEDVNLSRIISRPIRGCPREYAFLVDIEGHARAPRSRRALAAARKVSAELRLVGCYPRRRPFSS